MLGIIGAMGVEVAAVVGEMTDRQEHTVSGVTYYTGTFCGKEIVVAQCGVGKVFAGICAQTMILKFNVSHIINIGVGGSLDDRLNVCDIGIADGVVQHDMDTTPLGDPLGFLSGIDKVEIECDRAFCDTIETAAKTLGINCVRGIIASGDCFVGDSDKKKSVADTFNAIVCEMEGGAIGQVCYINGIPFNVIRAVSDKADGSADISFEKFTALAVEQSIKLLKEVMKSI
ncbi:MAG: 5'-methylthioadenosine/adenosylhomocysteine nucleosidase [Ruminococcaceae bacterium]|nr:5'-methylthioadenosine/adenosylhomocysteine nucleosidase [Oscillospiraceae bacterium]